MRALGIAAVVAAIVFVLVAIAVWAMCSADVLGGGTCFWAGALLGGVGLEWIF